MATEKLSLADRVAEAVENKFASTASALVALRSEGWPLKKTHLQVLVNRRADSACRTIPRSGLRALKVVLGLDISEDWREVDQKFEVTWAKKEPRTSKPARDFQGCIDAIDKLYLNYDPTSKKIATWTSQLIETLDHRHILISMTSGLYPPIVEWDGEKGQVRLGEQHRAYRVTALKNGLLWAYITPSLEFLKSLEEQGIRIEPDERHEQFAKGYKQLQQFLAENNVDSGVMQFEADFFPLTPFGWTTSVIGWRQDGHNRKLRVIVRTPHQRTQWYQMIQQTSDFEENVLRYSLKVLRKGSTSEARRAWVERFRQRIES